MEEITPLKAFQKSQEAKAEFTYLGASVSMFAPPPFRIERNPPKKRLQQELRLLSMNPDFRDTVENFRKRFWIPPYHTLVVYSSDPDHDDLSDLTDNLWIDLIERVPNPPEKIKIKVGGMDWENCQEWQDKLIGRKDKDTGEPELGILRLYIRWLLHDLGFPGQFGQALEQYILFGYAEPIPAFEIHAGMHIDTIYTSGSSLCIEIYPYTKASDITKHWTEVQQAMKQLWGTRGTRPKIAPNLERDSEWYRLVTQEGKKPKDIAESELEASYGDIDEMFIRTAVNRFKKRLERISSTYKP